MQHHAVKSARLRRRDCAREVCAFAWIDLCAANCTASKKNLSRVHQLCQFFCMMLYSGKYLYIYTQVCTHTQSFSWCTSFPKLWCFLSAWSVDNWRRLILMCGLQELDDTQLLTIVRDTQVGWLEEACSYKWNWKSEFSLFNPTELSVRLWDSNTVQLVFQGILT